MIIFNLYYILVCFFNALRFTFLLRNQNQLKIFSKTFHVCHCLNQTNQKCTSLNTRLKLDCRHQFQSQHQSHCQLHHLFNRVQVLVLLILHCLVCRDNKQQQPFYHTLLTVHQLQLLQQPLLLPHLHQLNHLRGNLEILWN